MISEEIQNLIVSWLSRGFSVPQSADLLQDKVSKRSIYRFALENRKQARRIAKKRFSSNFPSLLCARSLLAPFLFLVDLPSLF